MRKTIILFLIVSVIVLSVFFACKQDYDTKETVATPTFSPAAGTYSGAQSVYISCSTPGSTIYFTTDETDPWTGSIQYAGAINVSAMTTLKAIAVKDGWTNSAVASAVYIIDNVPTYVTKRDMVPVTGGTYTQTDVFANSFEHTISSFQMAKYEVTYELWYTVYQWAILPSNGCVLPASVRGKPGARV